MELHEKIRVMREMNQWSQEEMAEKLAMSANGYAKIERGQTKLTFDKLNQIAQIFKIDVVELITKEKPLFLLVGDNSHNYGSNYYGNNEALIAENEKLKLTISHNNEIIQRQENEILALKEIISLLKKINTLRPLQNSLLNHQESKGRLKYYFQTAFLIVLIKQRLLYLHDATK